MKDSDSALGTLDRGPLAATTNPVPTVVDVAFNFEEERQKDYRRYRGLLVIILMWVALAVFLMVAFRINVAPSETPLWEHPNYAGRYGYTWSLLILILPIVFLARWYRRNRDTLQLKPLMGALLKFSVWTSLGWISLDVLLANLFFTFPDERARAFFSVPGYTWQGNCATLLTIWNLRDCYALNVPFEEVVFYAASALLLAFMYMWATEDFFKDTAVPRDKYETLAQASGPLIHWNKTILAWGFTLAIISIVVKKLGDDWGLHTSAAGWPWYFFAQLVLVFAPLAALYNRVHIFTNPQAFLYVMQLQLLISLIWESTLAVPYGWWNYQPMAMMGITVTPWSNLQIEAIILWLAIGWSAMILYETGKIKVLSGKNWSQVLLGRHTWFRA